MKSCCTHLTTSIRLAALSVFTPAYLISDGTSDGVWVSLNKMKTDLDHEKSPQLLQLAANAVKCIGTI